MEFNKIFDDTDSDNLYKQIRDAQNYIHKELEKHISKELLLRILEKDLLPLLVYPDKITENAMPMWYSQGKAQIDIHTPKPDVKLLTVKEWIGFTGVGGTESFYDMIKRMKENVEKLE